jgi:hypothetical protein
MEEEVLVVDIQQLEVMMELPILEVVEEVLGVALVNCVV